ncbi:hypothetical protein LEMLEM_LOCUS16319, partial [Lemmus lemmus]
HLRVAEAWELLKQQHRPLVQVAAVPWVSPHKWPQNSQRLTCLCLPSAGMKCVHHHCLASALTFMCIW